MAFPARRISAKAFQLLGRGGNSPAPLSDAANSRAAVYLPGLHRALTTSTALARGEGFYASDAFAPTTPPSNMCLQ